uniref:Protein FAM136A n=1 Tax=Aceria tosichella TaxID=561515 RepID=A0A6G1S8Y1_9ACAR
MTEELGNQIQGMFKSIYDAADLKYMRPIKRHMFKCGYDCLDAKNTTKQAEECITECGRPMHIAMEIMQAEINTFQGRMDRCLMNCQDDVRNEKEEATAKRLFEGCAEKCVKSFVPAVPDVIKTLCEKLDKVKKDHKIS